MKNAAFSSLCHHLAAVVLLSTGFILAAPPATRAQDTAAYATLHSFDGIDGATPGNLVAGNDGNFYGTTSFGGFEYISSDYGSGFGNGTVFQITPQGELETIYVFAGADDGQHPVSLIKGTDGNFYGIAGFGVNNYGGSVFRITPAGELTTIYTTIDSSALGPLVQDDSGNFYGVASGGGIYSGASGAGKYGSIFRLTLAGVYTTLYTFTGGSDGTADYGLTLGSDGNFYSVSVGGANDNGTIYQITPQGAFTTLYTFSSTGDTDGFLPNGLTLGPDGNLYGTTQAGGTNFYGVIFRITNAGQFSVIYNFTGGSDSGGPIANLVTGLDGNLYGITAGDTLPTAEPAIVPAPPIQNPPAVPPGLPSVFFRVTTQGVLTPLYASATTIGGFIYGTDGFVQGSDGSFYGTSTGYADSDGSFSQGSVYKLTVESHPAFFTGQVPLVNGVDYLTFPNGNVFGYYTFLSDPDYLYHFDLGYEYLFDAKDGRGGVYLYDFASNDFFYTSPIFPFPYLYDFGLNSVLYYFPDPNNAGHYNTDGVRYFYDFGTGTVISK